MRVYNQFFFNFFRRNIQESGQGLIFMLLSYETPSCVEAPPAPRSRALCHGRGGPCRATAAAPLAAGRCVTGWRRCVSAPARATAPVFGHPSKSDTARMTPRGLEWASDSNQKWTGFLIEMQFFKKHFLVGWQAWLRSRCIRSFEGRKRPE